MKNNIGIIGCGNMGSAIMSQNRGMLAFDEDIKKMKAAKKCYKARVAFDIPDLIKKSNVVILAVKPQDIDFVLEEIRSVYQKELIISIAAGITTKYIEDKISGVKVIRVMPNIAAQVKSSISAMCKGRFARNSDLIIAEAIFKRIGKVVRVKENNIDAFTAIAGSGPAYFFYFIEALSDAGKRLGFQERQMADFVIEVAKGSVKLLVECKLSAKELREKVTSKGGTTEAALN
ncbi:MAG: pyrroline-5-carboxylate reductase, partial [Candidatus Omnitrophica bacterium]|nr:pyrroline-5-carboxylate reductase [Candidatus Omnitrophota bacterium]